MEFGLSVRFLLSMAHAIINVPAISGAIKSYRKSRYGLFGYYISLSILNVLMMARVVFCEI